MLPDLAVWAMIPFGSPSQSRDLTPGPPSTWTSAGTSCVVTPMDTRRAGSSHRLAFASSPWKGNADGFALCAGNTTRQKSTTTPVKPDPLRAS